MKIKRITAMLLTLILMTVTFAGCSRHISSDDNVVRIVHKNFTEQRLAAQVMSMVLESKGYKTTVTELGGTMLCYNALNENEADLYAEYTGTAYMGILGETKVLDAGETYDFVKESFERTYGITWLSPLGWNNTYILSVTSETAEKYDLETTTDIVPYSKDMLIGCTAEFANRTDGYPGLLKAYPGLSFKKVVTMDEGLMYDALKNDEVDVNVSFSTDGRISKFNLVTLADDASFFPPYHCVPIIKTAFIQDHPGVDDVLNTLAYKWTDEDMQKYNLMVDEGEDVKVVAIRMLDEAGLLLE